MHAYGKLPIGASRHTGTLDTRRFGSAWAGRDEPSRLRAGPHVRGARYGLTVAQVGLRLGTFRSEIPRADAPAQTHSTPVDSFRESNPLAAKGALVQGAFSLMAQAFSNYHNAAMPAIVGTSKLLAALNLPLDSRAKQIAARLVLCPCRECSKGQSDGTSPDASRRRNRPASQKDKPTPKGHGRRRHNDV